jgi:ribosomal protein S24E
MDFNIVVENENVLFKRKEIEGIVKSEVCPSREEILNFLSEKYSVSKDTVEVETIMGKFGSHEFVVVAEIYATKEDREATEIKTKKQREAEKKAKDEEAKLKAEQEAAAKEAENKSVEENKEEVIVKEDNTSENKDEVVVKEDNTLENKGEVKRNNSQ